MLPNFSSHSTTCLGKHVLQKCTAPNVRSSTLPIYYEVRIKRIDRHKNKHGKQEEWQHHFYLAWGISNSAPDEFTAMVLNLSSARNSLTPGERTVIIRCQGINNQHIQPYHWEYLGSHRPWVSSDHSWISVIKLSAAPACLSTNLLEWVPWR